MSSVVMIWLNFRLVTESLSHFYDYLNLHHWLLERYKQDKKALWSSVHDDGYIRAHLIYHLIQANRESEIHTLFQSAGWSNVRGFPAIITDFERAKSIVTDGDLANRIRYCFFDEALRNRYPQLQVEVLTEFIKRGLLGEQSAELLVTAIQGTSGDGAAKITAYLDVLKQLPQSLQAVIALEALHLSESINEPDKRAEGIKDLLFYVADEAKKSQWYPKFWQAVLQIEAWSIRDPLIQHLIKLPLSQTQWDSLLDDTLALLKPAQVRQYPPVFDRGNPYRCIYILELVLPAYPEPVWDSAWRKVMEHILENYTNPYTRGELFASLFKRLPKHLQIEYGDLVWENLSDCPHWEGMQEGDFYPNVFDPVTPFLLERHMLSVWERLKSLEDYWREWGQARFIPFTTPKIRKEILNDVNFEKKHDLRRWLQPLLSIIPYHSQDKQKYLYSRVWEHYLEDVINNYRFDDSGKPEWGLQSLLDLLVSVNHGFGENIDKKAMPVKV